MSFEFSLVEKAKAHAYFKQVEGIYLTSFPESQIRPTKMITHMLQFDPNYHLFLARQYDSIVGFSLLYAFKDLNAAFLDSMAIDRAYRDRGLGSNLLRYTVNASKQLVANSIGMIFEIEREKTTEHDMNGFRYRRIRFYRRLGAKAFDNVHYMSPNLHRGDPEDMYLMIIQNLDLVYLEKSFVIRIIKGIYRTLYHYLDDSNLLELTIKELPPTIRLI
jgi:ribosomal protein S18 acetylase RimI-like enzyme